jgi:hypothetical protein
MYKEALRMLVFNKERYSSPDLLKIEEALNSAQIFIAPSDFYLSADITEREDPIQMVQNYLIPPYPCTWIEFELSTPNQHNGISKVALLVIESVDNDREWVNCIIVKFFKKNSTTQMDQMASIIYGDATARPLYDIMQGTTAEEILEGYSADTKSEFDSIMTHICRDGIILTRLFYSIYEKNYTSGISRKKIFKMKLNGSKTNVSKNIYKIFIEKSLGEIDAAMSRDILERSSPREHLRRGHFRTINGKRIWVNSTVICKGSEGKVMKQYDISI